MDKNLIQRLITGSIFVVVLIGAIWWNAWSMFALFLTIAALGLWEFYGLAEKAGVEPQKKFGTSLGVFAVIAGFGMTVFPQRVYGYLLLVLLFLPFFIELYRKKEKPFANLGWTYLGLIYVALPLALLVYTFAPPLLLSQQLLAMSEGIKNLPPVPYHPAPLITFFVLIWISDSMAYVCGRLFGKHKLFERVSPKKTWEGYIGGLIFTAVAGFYIANLILYDKHNWHQEWVWTCTALVISITGTLGDLSESLFKRSIGVKDSGTLLPGHGGILDRFDALFLATPFALAVYWFVSDIFPIHY